MSSTTPTTSGSSVTALGDGYFSVDGETVNITDLIMLIGVHMNEVNDENLAVKYSEVEDKLDQQDELNDCLEMLNKYYNCFDSDGNVNDDYIGTVDSDNDKLTMTAEDMELWTTEYEPLLDELGIDDAIGSDGAFHQEEIDTTMENIKTELSSMSTQNELDMMDLNKLSSLNTTCMQLLQSGLSEASKASEAAAQS